MECKSEYGEYGIIATKYYGQSHLEDEFLKPGMLLSYLRVRSNAQALNLMSLHLDNNIHFRGSIKLVFINFNLMAENEFIVEFKSMLQIL